MTGGSPKHGINWAYGYAIVRPDRMPCGYITNPDADTMVELVPCNRVATYEFQFPGETVIWNGALMSVDQYWRLQALEDVVEVLARGYFLTEGGQDGN